MVNNTNLLSDFKKGEVYAGKVVFDTFFRPLCIFSDRITGDILQSEDIVSEVLEKLMFSDRDFSEISKLKNYLFTSVRNASLNYIAAQKRKMKATAQMQYLSADAHDDQAVLDIEIMRAELISQIYHSMDKLPGKCGLIFKMIFIDQLSTHEIAEKLQLNVQTVRSQKARAIALIKNNLSEKNLSVHLFLSLSILFSK